MEEPEMMNEGQKNTLELLKSGTLSDDDLNDQIEILKVLADWNLDKDGGVIPQGWELLDDKVKEIFTKTQRATEYLYEFALELKDLRGKTIERYIPEDKTKATFPISKAVLFWDEYSKIEVSKGIFIELTLQEKERELSHVDKLVMVAACSLYYEGVRTFTLNQLYKRVCSLPNMPYAKPESKEKYRESVDDLRQRDLTVNFQTQLDDWINNPKPYSKWEPPTELKRKYAKNYCLPLKESGVEHESGYIEPSYTFIDVPPIMEYTNVFNQIKTIEYNVFDVPKLRKDPENLWMLYHIVLWVVRNAEGGKNRKVAYNTILNDCFKNVKDMPSMQRIRKIEIIKKILTHLADIGYIKGFEEYTRQNKKTNKTERAGVIISPKKGGQQMLSTPPTSVTNPPNKCDLPPQQVLSPQNGNGDSKPCLINKRRQKTRPF